MSMLTCLSERALNHVLATVDIEEAAPADEPDEKSEHKVVEGDFMHRQTFTGWPLFILAAQATGTIYGDIGKPLL
jgi:hypothetical protein